MNMFAEITKASSNIKKYEYLESIATALDSEDLSALNFLAFDKDESIRVMTAEVLGYLASNSWEPLLLSMLNDKSHLVRAEACDSLFFAQSDNAIDQLKQHVLHDQYLVRGYAITTLIDIFENSERSSYELADFLKHALPREKRAWVRLNYYYALFRLGDESYLNQLLAGLNHRKYHNRCAAVHLADEILSAQNIEYRHTQHILSALKERLVVETCYAVEDSILKVLQQFPEK